MLFLWRGRRRMQPRWWTWTGYCRFSVTRGANFNGRLALCQALKSLPSIKRAARIINVGTCGVPTEGRSMGTYSIWVLEYGYVSEYPKAIAVHGAFGESIGFSYAYVLIKGNGQVAMVDVGYDNAAYGNVLNDRFGIKKMASATSGPSRMRRVTRRCVPRVCHPRAFRPFRRLRPLPQRHLLSSGERAIEIDLGDGARSKLRWLTAAVDANDIMRAVELARQGRLVCVSTVHGRTCFPE